MLLQNIHLFILACTAVTILIADHEGFLYMRGKKLVLDAGRTRFLHRAVWAGLLLMIATGVTLFIPRAEYLLSQPIFFAKMLVVLTLLINGWFIGTMAQLSHEVPFANLQASDKFFLLLSGALSGTGWLTAAVIGYFFL